MVPLPKSHHRYHFGPGEIDLVERPLRRGAEPEVPVEPLGDRRGFLGPLGHVDDVVVPLGRLLRLPAPGPADPDVHVVHRPDRAGLDQLDHAAVVVAGVDLRAHLGRDLGLRRRLADDPGLPDVVRQRLLAVDVLAQLQGRQRGEGVGVLGRAHDHRVELAGVVVELAEVAGIGVPWDGSEPRLVDGRLGDVAERHDVLGADVLEVGPAPAARADHGDIQLLVEVPAPHDRRRGEDARGRARHGLPELPTRRPRGGGG